MVTASAIERDNVFLVHCNFINGSNAEGCLVVLVGEFDNITTNITQRYKSFITLNATSPLDLSCYYDVFAYDIESDGSVGSLPVPGVLVDIHNVNITMPCLQK